MEKIIQIVEDDEDIRYILEYVLADSGYVLEMFDGIEAFGSRKNKADLIILDVRLPDGSGIELSRSLKSSASTANIPIIVMSAHANGKLAIIEGKADHFIEKPFDLDQFVLKIKTILDSSS